jgi:phosphopentomutase
MNDFFSHPIMINKTYKGSEFVDKFENTHFSFVNDICNTFIDAISKINTSRTDMSRADWLDVMMYNYNVVINNQIVSFEPCK